MEPILLIHAFIRSRRIIGTFAVIGGLLGVLTALVVPEKWGTEFSFTVSARTQSGFAGSIRGLTSQLGLTVPGEESLRPEYFVYLLRTTRLLGMVASTPMSPNGNAILADLVSDGKLEQRKKNAISILTEMIEPDFDSRTGVITVTVRGRDSLSTISVARATVLALEEHLRSGRRSQVRAQREFLESQVTATRTQLDTAERALALYQQQNRRLSDAPFLNLELRRLERTVQLRMATFLSQAEALQNAKIDEVRDTPVISVVERPEDKLSRSSRRLVFRVLVAVTLGALIAAAAVLMRMPGNALLQH